jgi:hypothetical protein
MKLAAIKYSSRAPRSEYPTSTEPATVESPPTITANNSERVILSI